MMNDRKIIEQLEAMLQGIRDEDSRDADLATDGTEDILQGRAELATTLLDWVTQQQEEKATWKEFDKWLQDCPVPDVTVESGDDDEDWLIISINPSQLIDEEDQEEKESDG